MRSSNSNLGFFLLFTAFNICALLSLSGTCWIANIYVRVLVLVPPFSIPYSPLVGLDFRYSLLVIPQVAYFATGFDITKSKLNSRADWVNLCKPTLFHARLSEIF